MKREKLTLADSGMDILFKMSEGNPGALNVLMKMQKAEPEHHLFTILNLDDMNIRGSAIWIGYKNHCQNDITKFIQAVKARDSEMIDKINAELIAANTPFSLLAVNSGASYKQD